MALSLGVTAVASASSAATVTTPSRTTTWGSTIVLCGDWNAGGPFVSFTDSYGNTWEPIETELGSSPTTRMYYATNIKGGTGHTFTLAITSAGQPSIWMVEILSSRTMVVLDLGARQTDAASPFDSPGILTTVADTFLVGFIGGNSVSNPATHTAGASFTLLDQVTNGASFWPGATAYRIVTATGTYNSSFTESGASSGRVWIAAFKEAQGLIEFVNKGSAKTPDLGTGTIVDITIPATVAGNDLVVKVAIGDATAPTSVTGITATGASFSFVGAITNGTVRLESWIARGVAAGITTVRVTVAAAQAWGAICGEYANPQSVGINATASGTSANPSVSLTTQDSNNRLVAGLANQGLATGAYTAASAGTLRGVDYVLGSAVDIPFGLIDRLAPTAASIAATMTHAATPEDWAAAAVELRSVAVGVLTPSVGAAVLAGNAPSRVIGTILTPATP